MAGLLDALLGGIKKEDGGEPEPEPEKPQVASLGSEASAARAAASVVSAASRGAGLLGRATRGPGAAAGADSIQDDLETWMKAKTLLRPDDQLALSEDDLKGDVSRVLTALNPLLPDGLVVFSQQERQFVPVPPLANDLVLLVLEGCALHQDSEEAQAQALGMRFTLVPVQTAGEVIKDILGDEDGGDAGLMGVGIEAEEEEGEEEGEEEDEGEEEEGEEEEGEEDEGEEDEGDEGKESKEGGKSKKDKAAEEEDDEDEEDKPKRAKKMMNQFNFCERAALTYNNPERDTGTQTVPPPRTPFARQVDQGCIYDGYADDQAAKQRTLAQAGASIAASMAEGGGAGGGAGGEGGEDEDAGGDSLGSSRRMLAAAKALERMVNQNLFDDIAQDYRYWNDPSDEYKGNEGSLLPLWKFHQEAIKKATVTCLCWNPTYYDMFAACYGTFNCQDVPAEGAVCLFSLKNPSFPEYTTVTWSPAMCCDIHPHYPYLLAVGLYDGNVLVYNVHLNPQVPQHRSEPVRDKHLGTVTQVAWGEDMLYGEVNFFSLSSDGYLCNWIISQKSLSRTAVLGLVIRRAPLAGPDGVPLPLMGCGSAFALHPTKPLVVLVGSDQGTVHKCCTAYGSTYMYTLQAHHMPVHRIAFNPYNASLFITCSADWRIKIWEDNRPQPLFVFDLASPVGDVAWSPFSSTVFAAVAGDGKVRIFDVSLDEYAPVCEQAVVSKRRYRLTRIAFNLRLPVLVVGDDRGGVGTLKLSPNLRREVKQPRKGPQLTPFELETAKLDRVLENVREPRRLRRPPDRGEGEEEEEEEEGAAAAEGGAGAAKATEAAGA